MTINTGIPRNIPGHIISGGIASGVVAGATNYAKFQKDEISKKDAIKNSLRLTIQGAVATGSAIAAANYVGKGNWLGAIGAISLGLSGIYATQKLSEIVDAKLNIEDKKTETNEIGE